MKKFMGKTMAKMNENRRNGRRALKGFTLVEIIVVLVILAILAAAMIPALTGYIDKAKERTAISEARNVLTAAQTLASEEYGLHGTTNLYSDSFKSLFGNKALALADIGKDGDNYKGTIKKIAFDTNSKAKISSLVYIIGTESDGTWVTYTGGEFIVGADAKTAADKITENTKPTE